MQREGWFTLTQNSDVEIQKMILRIVRGQDDWSCAQSLGVSLTRQPSGLVWRFSTANVTLTSATVDDIIEGTKKLKANPHALQEWASFMLASSSLITFEDLEKSSKSDAALDILWNLSSGEDPESQLRELEKLLL